MKFNIKLKKLVISAFLTISLFALASFVYASQPEVAGAGPYTEPTPTRTPALSPSFTPVVSVSHTPTPTTTPAPQPSTNNERGIWNWLRSLGSSLWLILGVLVVIIVSVYYLLHRKKNETPPPSQ